MAVADYKRAIPSGRSGLRQRFAEEAQKYSEESERSGERRITLQFPVSAESSQEYTNMVSTLRGGT